MSEEAKHLPTAVESEITGFDSSKLKHTECHEKSCLPTADGIDLFSFFCVFMITSICDVSYFVVNETINEKPVVRHQSNAVLCVNSFVFVILFYNADLFSVC